MGTRHLICAVVDGQIKLAQYGRWDGYPSGQGKTVCEFIDRLRSEPAAQPAFKEALRQCSFLTEAEIEEVNKEIKGRDDWGEWKHLSRDNGANILNIVLDNYQNNGKPMKLHDSTNFAADSLFCEYAYVIDMDNRKLEFYTGFNKQGPQPGSRFGNVPLIDPGRSQQYYPVVLRGIFNFTDAPTVEMLELCEPKEWG